MFPILLQATCALTVSLALTVCPTRASHAPAVQEPAAEPGAIEVTYGNRKLSFSSDELRDWLVRFEGPANAARFVQAQLIGERALALGYQVTEAQVRERTNAEIEQRIGLAFDGDIEGWLKELRQTGRTAEGVRRQRQLENRTKLEAEHVAIHQRQVTEADVETEFRRRFGPGGLSWKITPLSIRLLQPSPPDGTAPEERRRLRSVARDEHQARIDALYEELQAGADFDELNKQYGEDLSQASVNVKFPEKFPPSDWPKDHLDDIQALPIGAFAPPVYARGSFHILRIDARHVTSLDEVREQIKTDLRERIASAKEVLGVLGQTLDETDWAVLPAMKAAPQAGPRPGSEAVLRIGEREVSRDEFGDWLAGLNGEHRIPLFVEYKLVELLAAETGFVRSREETMARIHSDIEETIERIYGGRIERFLQQNSVASTDQFAATQVVLVEHQLATEHMISSQREVTEEQLSTAWKERYGAAGRAVRARVIELEAPEVGADVAPKDSRAERDRLFAETEQLAARLVERINNGEDFATLASRHSAHPSREQGGELNDLFTPADWPLPIQEAVLLGRTGAVLGPLSDGPSIGRVWVFELLESRAMPFEEVRPQLLKELATIRPTVGERAEWLNILMQRLEIARR